MLALITFIIVGAILVLVVVGIVFLIKKLFHKK